MVYISVSILSIRVGNRIKRIGAVDARKSLGRIMNEVSLRMDQYIIERRGKPLVAVIPIQQFEKWLETRQEFFEAVENIRTANKIVSPRKIEKEVAETVKNRSRKSKG